jgi:uncharacterized membrane protein
MASAKSPRETQSEPVTLGEHIEQNIDSIVAMQKRDWQQAGRLQRYIETLSNAMSRPAYLVGLVSVIAVWLLVNLVGPLFGFRPWDDPPFAVLDSLMTLVALVTGTVVLVGQQRQGKLEQQHSQLALQISLLTEQKTAKLIFLLEELRRDMPMVKDRHDAQSKVLQESPNAEQLLTALTEKSDEGAVKEQE